MPGYIGSLINGDPPPPDIAERVKQMARHESDSTLIPSSHAELSELASNRGRSLDHTSMWSSTNGLYWPSKETYKELPPALYKCGHSDALGTYLVKVDIKSDSLLLLEDCVSSWVLNEVDRFLALENKFREHGFLHKRGILLYGPPGSGKTSTLNLLVQDVIARGGIVLFLEHPNLGAECLRMIRRIEPHRLILVLMEDFDALVNRYDESAYLALLDGETQVDKVVFLATTNYIEKLDKRFTNRPSRFDTIQRVGMPSDGARRQYLRWKLPSLQGADLDTAIAKTKGYSIAHLRELVVLLSCFGQDLDTAIQRINWIAREKSSADFDAGGPGFLQTRSSSNDEMIQIKPESGADHTQSAEEDEESLEDAVARMRILDDGLRSGDSIEYDTKPLVSVGDDTASSDKPKPKVAGVSSVRIGRGFRVAVDDNCK
jgi:hypothetical protein